MFTKKEKNSEKVISFQLMELSERFLNEVLELTFHPCTQYKKAQRTGSIVCYVASQRKRKKHTSGNKSCSVERMALALLSVERIKQLQHFDFLLGKKFLSLKYIICNTKWEQHTFSIFFQNVSHPTDTVYDASDFLWTLHWAYIWACFLSQHAAAREHSCCPGLCL